MAGEQGRRRAPAGPWVPEKFSSGDAMVTAAVTRAGTAVGRDGAMTPDHDINPFRPARSNALPPVHRPLRQLSVELARRSVCADARDAAARLEQAGVPFGDCADLFELARSCQPGGDLDHAAAVISALSGLVPGTETAGLCLLVAFAPALEHMAAWLAARGAKPEDAEASAIAALWEAACRPGRREGSCLYRAAWTTLRHEVRRELRHRRAHARSTECDSVELTPDVADCLEVLLGDAVRAGALRRDQAELLHALYEEDVPAWVLAASSGRSVWAVSMARRRAERALGAFVTQKVRS